MTKKRGLCIVSGIFVLASLLLAQLHSPYWMVLTVLFGLDMLQSGFTDWGFVAWMLNLNGVKPSVQKQAQAKHGPE